MKKNRNKRDPYKAFLEYVVFIETVILLTWLVCDMAFK